MFETVVPEVMYTRSRRIFYETLPVSIAVHAMIVAAAVTGAVWNVVFPTQSPRVVRAYSLVSVPDPPPPPPPPAPPQPKQPVLLKIKAPPALRMVHLDVAPTIIPDLVPRVEPPPPEPPPPPAPEPAAPPVTAGPSVGSADGVPGGQIGGVKHGTPGGIVFAEDGRVHIDRTEKLPLKEIDKGYPHYPEAARSKRLEDTCVVRYTIGKNGRVIDIAVIEHAKDAMFDEETVNTVRLWRFRPLTVNGKPVEVVHEVEVYYQFISR
jgi:periplasmic protein TonB